MTLNIRDQASISFPLFEDVIQKKSELAESVWFSDFRTGKALEVISLLALVSRVRERADSVHTDRNFISNPNLFYLRNEIPQHHGAQAGHEALLQTEISLEERFLAAFIPKTHLKLDGKCWMIFREGNPLHLLYNLVVNGSIYKDRCDIALVRGLISNVQIERGLISFTHEDGDEHAFYELKLKNTSIIPLKNFKMSKNYRPITSGVVECSVSKRKDHVDNQLTRYRELFRVCDRDVACLFVHGDQEKSIYKTMNVDLADLVNCFTQQKNLALFDKFFDECFA